MSRTVRSIDGISILTTETFDDQREAVRRAIRYGVTDAYRNRFDTKAVKASRRLKNGLPKTKHRARRIQVMMMDQIYVTRRPSQQREEQRAYRWPATAKTL